MPYYVYVIEIGPQWRDKIPHGNKVRRLDHLYYVGSTGNSPARRYAEHLAGTRSGTSGAASTFIKIRKHREAAGLPGPLVDGEDAWLVPEMTESFDSRADAERAEGRLADLLIREDKVWALSDMSSFTD